jgi:hypothetical protein
MAAEQTMPLTRLEREAINDSVLKIQSIQASLQQVEDSRIPGRAEIDGCLETADQSLRSALREDLPGKKLPTRH